MARPPISTARPRERALRDRRNARMDVVGARWAFGIRDVAAGAQTLTKWRAEVQPGINSKARLGGTGRLWLTALSAGHDP